MKNIIRLMSFSAALAMTALVNGAETPPPHDPMQPPAPDQAGTQTAPAERPRGMISREESFHELVRSLAREADIRIIIPEPLTGTVTVDLRGLHPKEALRSLLESRNYTLVEDKNTGIFTVQTKAAESPEVVIHNLDYANIKDVVPAVRAILTQRGKLEVVGSALIISDVPSNLPKIQELIRRLDEKTAQVLIETRLYEMVRNPKKELGFDWSRTLGGIGINTKFGGEPSQGQLTPFLWNVGQTGPKSMPATAVLTNSQLELVIRFLNSDTDTELIATPRIVTANNREAVIKIVTEEPIPNFQFNARTAAFEISGFQFKEIGNILKVTPSVNKAGFITLDVVPEVSNVVGFRTFGGTGASTASGEGTTTVGGSGLQANIPVVSTRNLATRVLLKDGDTLMIGGLVQTDKINTYHKVPVLGDIPIMGMFFRDKTLETRKRNLLIFITPNELKGDQKTGFEDQADGLKQNEVYTDDAWMPRDNAKPKHLPPPRQEDLEKKRLAPRVNPGSIKQND
jgi:type II secretory pathway component GspD/PulD (secretin)